MKGTLIENNEILHVYIQLINLVGKYSGFIYWQNIRFINFHSSLPNGAKFRNPALHVPEKVTTKLIFNTYY